jgi:hypothetical protein
MKAGKGAGKKGNELTIKKKRTREEVLASFTKKYKVEAKTGCWVWQGAVANRSRGTGIRGNMLGETGIEAAHRVSWKLFRPDEPIEGLYVGQSCHNALCVNPKDLFSQKGRPVLAGEHHPLSRLNDYTVMELRHLRERNRNRNTLQRLADRYNVSREAVRRIVHGMSLGGMKIPQDIVEQIKKDYQPKIDIVEFVGLPENEIARSTLEGAASGRTWRHVGEPPVDIGSL